MRRGDDATKVAVRLLITFLFAAALLLIVVIAGGSEFDDTSGRAIGTAVALAFLSLTGFSGVNLAQRRPDLAAFGYLTALASLVAFIAVAGAIWSDDLWGNDWRAAVDTIVFAIASGHASLLLGGARDDDSDGVRAARAGTLMAILVLCAMAIVEISSRGVDVGAQPIAVMAVLYMLGTALVPLLRRLSPGEPRHAAPSQNTDADGRLVRLDHVVIGVTDWERSNAFYRDVLGAEIVSMPQGRVAYRIGNQQLNVHGPGAEAAPLPAEPVRPGNSDLCFLWEGSLDAAVEHLHGHAVQIVEGPASRIGACGIGQSVYFHDPDGSLIELISYV